MTNRPVLRWNPYPDAVRYVAVVMLANAKPVFTRPLTETSVQVDDASRINGARLYQAEKAMVVVK